MQQLHLLLHRVGNPNATLVVAALISLYLGYQGLMELVL